MRRLATLALAFTLSALCSEALQAQCNPQEAAEFGPALGAVGDRFGKVLARSGNTIVLGAPETGKAYVFERNLGAGAPWTETVTLSGVAGEFGSAVAIDGDTLVVGSPKILGLGHIRIHGRDQGGAGTWGLIKQVQASNIASADRFGARVAISGDTLLVAATHANRGLTASGAVYILERNSGGPDNWGEVKELTPAPRLFGQQGTGLAIEGDRAVVGEPGSNVNSSFFGRARIYERSAGTWSFVKLLSSPNPGNGDEFGFSAALQGDELVVGAPYNFTGMAHVFRRDQGGAGSWGLVTSLQPPTIGGQVGWSVDLDGDLLAAGAPYRGAPQSAGRVLLYGRDFAGQPWGQMAKIAGTTLGVRDYFGSSVALDGGELVVGTDEENAPGNAYHFEGLVEFPYKYCPSGLSASTCLSVICGAGTPSATASSGFVVTAQDMEGAKSGRYFWGANGQQQLPWGDGASFQCVVGPVSRGALLSGGGTVGNCDGTFSYDLNTRWTQQPHQNPGAGAVVQMQLWTRDPLNTSSQKTILSNGLQFTVGP